MSGCGAFGSLFFGLTTGVEGFNFESFEVVGCSSSRVLRFWGLWEPGLTFFFGASNENSTLQR